MSAPASAASDGAGGGGGPVVSRQYEKEDVENDAVHLICSSVNLDYKPNGACGPWPHTINEAWFSLMWQLLADVYSFGGGTCASICLDHLEPSTKGMFLSKLRFVLCKVKSGTKQMQERFASSLQDTEYDQDRGVQRGAPEQRFRLWSAVIYVHADDPLHTNRSYDAERSTLYDYDVVRVPADQATESKRERLVLVFCDDGKRFLRNMHRVPLLDKMMLMQDSIEYMNKSNIQFASVVKDDLLVQHKLFDFYFSYYLDALCQRREKGTLCVQREGNVTTLVPSDDKGENHFLCTAADLNKTEQTRELSAILRDMYVRVSNDQQLALRLVCEHRKNTFITGAGGVGKSRIINVIKRKLAYAGTKFYTTASTGKAAVGIGGFTLHRFMGIGIGEGTLKECVGRVYRKGKSAANNPTLSRLLTTDVLIVDEISMVHPDYFRTCDRVLRMVRHNASQLFGGMQVILCGDFLQLPPVMRDRKVRERTNKPVYCFELDEWKKGIELEVEFRKIYRQKDGGFIKLLNSIREGKISADERARLERRMLSNMDEEVRQSKEVQDATHIFSRNWKVDRLNKQRLEAIDEELHEYAWTVTFHPHKYIHPEEQKRILKHFEQNLPVSAAHQYKVGTRILLTVNLDPDRNLVNGSGGYIVGFEREKNPNTLLEIPESPLYPVVQFDDLDEPEVVKPHRFYYMDSDARASEMKQQQSGENGDPLPRKRFKDQFEWRAVCDQIPLVLGWSFSIHKCVSGDTLISTTNGLIPIEKICAHMENNSLDDDATFEVHTKNGTANVVQLYRGSTEPSIKITTQLGYQIEGSHRHPLLVVDKYGKETWKKLPDLSIGDTVTLRLGCGSAPNPGQYLGTEHYSHPSDMVSKRAYKIPETIDEDLCWLFGVLIGDCWINSRTEIQLCKSDLKLVQRAKTILEDRFAVVAGWSVEKRSDDGGNSRRKKTVYRTWISSVGVRTFLCASGLQMQKAREKDIPWTVLQSPLSCQKSFVQGLFDTDGSVAKSDRIVLATSSTHLAKQTQSVLANLGILSNLDVLKSSNAKYDDTYHLRLQGYYAHLFETEIGFYSEKKSEISRRNHGVYKQKTPRSNVSAVPNGQQLILSLRKSIHQAQGSATLKRYSVLKGDLSKLVSKICNGICKFRFAHVRFLAEHIKNIEQYGQAGMKIKNMHEKGILYDEIKVIEHGQCEMFDLYVPDGHNFVGNSFVNHNSQGMSIKRVVVSVEDTFDYGQSYVAYSRAESEQGLYVDGANPGKIQADQRVVKYYRELRKSMKDERKRRKLQLKEERLRKRSRIYLSVDQNGARTDDVYAEQEPPAFIQTVDYTKQQPALLAARSSTKIFVPSPEEKAKQEQETLDALQQRINKPTGSLPATHAIEEQRKRRREQSLQAVRQQVERKREELVAKRPKFTVPTVNGSSAGDGDKAQQEEEEPFEFMPDAPEFVELSDVYEQFLAECGEYVPSNHTEGELQERKFCAYVKKRHAQLYKSVERDSAVYEAVMINYKETHSDNE